MKTKTLLILISILPMLFSCGESSTTPTLPGSVPGKVPSTGGPREIVAVVANEIFSDSISSVLQDELSPALYGMPQAENETKLYIVPATSFNNLYQSHHSLVFIDKTDSIPEIKNTRNVYAAPQQIVSIKVHDYMDLRKILQGRSEEIIRSFLDADIATLQHKLSRIAHSRIKYVEDMGVEMTIPNYYRPVMAREDFVWLLKDIKKGKHLGTVNILIYKYPIEEDTYIDQIALRDSITKKYVHGEMAGSYMEIEKRYYPLSIETELDSMFAIESRGMWRTEGDFMGGPFINYTLWDDATNTIYGIDGFVYFPSQDKSQYIFELEALLKTFHLSGR
ncbi:MAG: DUF4837 family protein [Flavobacteriales bacterium]|nr:DUF4837 family protein [Flavobacteriales bacterium]